MELLRWKARISMLWIIMVTNYLVFAFVNLQESGGASGEGVTLISPVLAFIPFIMAWLSLTLKDLANRWTNLVLGILYAVLFITFLIQYVAAGRSTSIIVVTFFGFLADILIIWYTLKWPKQEV